MAFSCPLSFSIIIYPYLPYSGLCLVSPHWCCAPPHGTLRSTAWNPALQRGLQPVMLGGIQPAFRAVINFTVGNPI